MAQVRCCARVFSSWLLRGRHPSSSSCARLRRLWSWGWPTRHRVRRATPPKRLAYAAAATIDSSRALCLQAPVGFVPPSRAHPSWRGRRGMADRRFGLRLFRRRMWGHASATPLGGKGERHGVHLSVRHYLPPWSWPSLRWRCLHPSCCCGQAVAWEICASWLSMGDCQRSCFLALLPF